MGEMTISRTVTVPVHNEILGETVDNYPEQIDNLGAK